MIKINQKKLQNNEIIRIKQYCVESEKKFDSELDSSSSTDNESVNDEIEYRINEMSCQDNWVQNKHVTMNNILCITDGIWGKNPYNIVSFHSSMQGLMRLFMMRTPA